MRAEIVKRTPLTAGTWRPRASWRWRGWSALALGLTALLGLGLALWPAAPAQGAPPAPSFHLPLLSGGHGALSLRALRGHPVLLNFFQSDCAPCLDEMPMLARIARAYKTRGLVVVGISSLGDAASAAQSLARADHLPFPVVSDAHQSVAWQY